MADGVIVEVSGLKELEANLRQFSDDVRDKMLTDATRAGAEVVQVEAINLAPKKRGLASSLSIASRIKIRMKQPDQFGVRALIVAGAPHSHLLEFGTKPHKIVTKTKKALADKAANLFFGKVVNHPGNRARPFLRPAFEMRKLEAVNRIADVLREKIRLFRAASRPKVVR
jgi:HK97 gp10 family phage protein